MSLIKCKECGKIISSEAKSCPYCGRKIRGNLFLQIVGVVFIFWIIGFLANVDNNNNHLSNTSSIKRTVTSVNNKENPYLTKNVSGKENKNFCSSDEVTEKTIQQECKNCNTKEMQNKFEEELVQKKCVEYVNEFKEVYGNMSSKDAVSHCKCLVKEDYKMLLDSTGEKAQKYMNTIISDGINNANKCLETLINEKDYIKRGKKFFGCLPWCKNQNFYDLVSSNFGNLPASCRFKLSMPLLRVIQQTDEGTIVSIPGTEFVYFIDRNEKDSSLVDNSFVSRGIFIRTVLPYSYINTIGAKKTVHMLIRVE